MRLASINKLFMCSINGNLDNWILEYLLQNIYFRLFEKSEVSQVTEGVKDGRW